MNLTDSKYYTLPAIIFRLFVFRQLYSEFWLTVASFFASSRNQHGVTYLKNLRRLKQTWGKKFAYQIKSIHSFPTHHV